MTTAREILERRARALTRRPAPEAAGESMTVVEFLIARERFAIEAAEVAAAFTLDALSPLPGAELPVAGITMWRGTFVTLLDVRPELGLSPAALNELRLVLVLAHGRSRAGMLIDGLTGTVLRRHDAFELAPARSVASGTVRGISREGVTLIDARALLRQHINGEQSP